MHRFYHMRLTVLILFAILPSIWGQHGRTDEGEIFRELFGQQFRDVIVANTFERKLNSANKYFQALQATHLGASDRDRVRALAVTDFFDGIVELLPPSGITKVELPNQGDNSFETLMAFSLAMSQVDKDTTDRWSLYSNIEQLFYDEKSGATTFSQTSKVIQEKRDLAIFLLQVRQNTLQVLILKKFNVTPSDAKGLDRIVTFTKLLSRVDLTTDTRENLLRTYHIAQSALQTQTLLWFHGLPLRTDSRIKDLVSRLRVLPPSGNVDGEKRKTIESLIGVFRSLNQAEV